MAKKPTSRLMKRQQAQLWRSTLIFGFLGIVLLLGFIFVVLPNFARISLLFGGDGGVPDFSDTLPPQRPILAAAPTATNSASLEITGFTEPESTAHLVWDGVAAKQVGVDSEGNFTFTLLLKEGRNTLSVFAADDAENESPPSNELVVTYDSTEPELEIANPADGSTFEGDKNRLITIEGTTEVGAKIFINERMVSPKFDGTFTTTYRLEEGENQMTIIARDVAGNETSMGVVYTYKK